MEPFFFAICLVGIGMYAAASTSPDSADGEPDITGLVHAFRQGDEQAFGELVRLFQTRIYTLALNYLKDTEEAKDTSQDIFVTVYRAIHTLHEESKFSAWLYQLALNHCRNRYKQLRRKGFYNSQQIDNPEAPLHLTAGQSPEQLVEREDIRKMVQDTIAQMSDSEKEILMLRDIQALSYEEISVVLDIPLGTVKSKLNRARLALKDRLKNYM